MSCEVYIPQVQVVSGQWIEVGIPTSTFIEADRQRSQFPLTNNIVAFRVIQSNCLERKIQRTCCGGSK